MERQRNMSQTKEQNKAPEKEFNKIETSSLPDAEFKILVIRMLNDLSENFDKDIKNIKMELSLIHI